MSRLTDVIAALEKADDILCAALRKQYGKNTSDHRYYESPEDSQQVRDAKAAYLVAVLEHSAAWQEVHERARKQRETA